MSPGKFGKSHLKIRIFVHSGSKFQYKAFTRLISRWDRKFGETENWTLRFQLWVMSRSKSLLVWAVPSFAFRKLGLFLGSTSKWWALLVSKYFYFRACHYMDSWLGSVCSCGEWPLFVSSLVCLCSWIYISAIVITCDVFPITCWSHVLVLRNYWWTS